MTRITIEELRLRRPKRDGGFVLGPLSLEIAAGANVAILGPSGCGKTTLLRCIAGLETPDSGSVRLGECVAFDGVGGGTPPSERQIGFVPQDAGLWPHLNALQHLRFVDPSLTRAAARALLAQVGLADRAKQRPAQLSGGEGQRLALARALAGGPRTLLLDEPLNSVDVPLRDELGLLIHRIALERGLGFVVVTHDRREALALADTLVVMHAGRIVESGDAASILREPTTSYGAAFVSGAARLPAIESTPGSVETPFGSLPRPADLGGAIELVVLPGDVVVNPGAADAVRARALRVVAGVTATEAMVELDGHTLRVADCPAGTRAGDELRLTLRGVPRLLRMGVDR